MTDSSYAFISYSSVDRPFVSTLADDLETEGVKLWWDQHRTDGILVGADWEQEIQEKLSECTHVIVVLTPSSVNSKMVKAEIQTAFEKGKQFVPLLLDNVQGVPLQLKPVQYLDMRKPNMYQENIRRLTQYLILGKLIHEDRSGKRATLQSMRKAQQRRSSLISLLIMFVLILLIGIIFIVMNNQTKMAIGFLIDTSANMQGMVNGRSRQDIANEIIQSVIINNNITENYWLGIRTTGGGINGDCENTSLISEMEGKSGYAAEEAFVMPLNGILPNGNTAYVAGLDAMLNDLKRHPRRVVFIFIGSVNAIGCQKDRLLDIPTQLDKYKDEGVPVALCAFTLLDDVGQYESLKRRLEDKDIDCVQNIDNVTNTSSYVNLAIRMINAVASDKPTPIFLPTLNPTPTPTYKYTLTPYQAMTFTPRPPPFYYASLLYSAVR